MKKLVIVNLVFLLTLTKVQLVYAQHSSLSTNYNFIATYTPQIPIQNASGLIDQGVKNVNLSVQYFDGLGRAKQTVDVFASPGGNDIVQIFAYDQFGRETKKYLPYTTNSGNFGSFRDTAISSQAAFYNNPPAGIIQIPSAGGITPSYAETKFEASPLERIIEQGSPGKVWQMASSRNSTTGRTVVTDYSFNEASNVRLWIINGITCDGSQYYPAADLFKTIIKDENWTSADGLAGTIEEYKDKSGQLVLKRVWQDGVTALDTYYIYDNIGNLRYVLPPGVVGTYFAEGDSTFEAYVYAYNYNELKQVVKKKLPGKDWEELVYNNRNQLVFSQDAIQKANHIWMFNKYDGLGRVIITGIVSSTKSSEDWQDDLDNPAQLLWEERDDINASGTSTGYTNLALPSHSLSPVYYTINYYDNYTYNAPYAFGNQSYSLSNTNLTHGLLTGTKVNVLGSTQYLNTVNYYNNKGALIQRFSENLQAGVDQLDFDYLFTGQVRGSTKIHAGLKSETMAYQYNYDHSGRKKRTSLEVDDYNFTQSDNSYNELGQLVGKRLGEGGWIGTSYAYNERGWLTKIGDLQNVDISQPFGMELTYADRPGTYNGNISNINWQTYVTPGLGLYANSQRYEYSYDKLNRLTLADYKTSGTIGKFNEEISYNNMGNIVTLKRKNALSGYMNDLNFDYASSGTGNKLWGVTDIGTAGQNSLYSYNLNGSMISDSGKGITNISYNQLGLPETIIKGSGNIVYTYDATGKKLRKVAGGITRDYIDNIEYVDGDIESIQTEDGRLVANIYGDYNYEYYFKDHLGNIRIVLDGNEDIVQIQDYYAFGLEMNPGNALNNYPLNQYKYNGKEKQPEWGVLDYGARFYDPVIGRFTTVDPLSEKHHDFTSYAYVLNNPLKFTDPLGLDTVAANKVDFKKFDAKSDVIALDEVKITGSKPRSIEEKISDIWNGALARSHVPDKLTLSLSSSLTVFAGENTTLSFDWITRGHDASFMPYTTFTVGGQVGPQISADALIGVGAGYFATSDMRSLAPGQAANGLLGWSSNVSVDAGAGLGGSITGSVGFSNTPFTSRPTWISGGVAGGASIGAGGTVGVSYTLPIFQSQFNRKK